MLKSVSNKDILWSLLAQFFSLLTGILTLPLILKKLTANEIGINYIMLTIGSIVVLFDFGFSAQFGRNINYIFSGVKKLKHEGHDVVNEDAEINYHLLATMIKTAEYIYRKISFYALIVLLSFGTLYIYSITDNFKSVNNILIIWIVYSISVFFNIYYTYFASLLIGKGLVTESNKSIFFSKIAYLCLIFVFLNIGLGLIGVVLAGLISPFFQRYFSYKYFFTNEIKNAVDDQIVTSKDKSELFKSLWFNSKKLGLIAIGTYVVNKFNMFIAGAYLPLSEVASLGLLLQLFGILTITSSTLFNIYQPRFTSYRVRSKTNLLLNDFAFSMIVFYFLFILGSLIIIEFGPILLSKLHANINLPSTRIVILFAIIALLEANHSNFATLILTENKIPFVNSTIIVGLAIVIGNFISIHFTKLGVIGLIIVQGIVQLSYPNWKWPKVILKYFNINYPQFLLIGINELKSRVIKRNYGR